jgi:hypothetical protein
MHIRSAWGLATLLGLTSPALAEDCRLALVLALDVSNSVDRDEDRLQQEGLAHALLSYEVVRAFLQGDPVALFAFEWAGAAYQADVTPGWQMVRTEKDLARVAAAMVDAQEGERSRPHRLGATGLGTALHYAAGALNNGPDCRARTIDISGDGENNDGPDPEVFYESPLFNGVTVNALVIGGALELESGPRTQEQRLAAWFEAHVLRGPDAFWILAHGYDDYERAMRAKLLRELQTPAVSGWLTAEPKG